MGRDHPRRVEVIGGGPGGLFSARLLKRRHPDWEVTVHERLPSGTTYGFGVGLTGALLEAVRGVDPELCADVLDVAYRSSTARFLLPAGTADLSGFNNGVSIGRTELLEVLLGRVRQAGVAVCESVSPDPEALRSADLVVAADGVSSATRERLASDLRPSVTPGRGLFIWCGSEIELAGTTFLPVRTADGLFVAHAYPYAPGRSTVVIETDEVSRRAAGLDAAADLDPLSGESDERSLDYLSAAFASLTDGRRLLGNRSRWAHFRVVSCARWVSGNTVLVGDAAATAHPSLGSGTKSAMESAIALAEAFSGPSDSLDVAAALARFEADRRPAVDRLQGRALRSMLWWESFGRRLDLAPARVAVSFLSRAGVLTMDGLDGGADGLAARAASEYAGVAPDEAPSAGLTDWVLERPLALDGVELASRVVVPPEAVAVDGPVTILEGAGGAVRVSGVLDVDDGDAWGPAGQRLVDRAVALLAATPGAILLTGADDRAAVLDRLALGERLRTELGALVVAAIDPAHRRDAADGLVAGRIDLVAMPRRAPSPETPTAPSPALRGTPT